jgi:putative hemolysin
MSVSEPLIAIILVLVFAGGFFTLFEEAFKAVRRPRLQKAIDDAEKHSTAKRSGQENSGKANKYRRVLELGENPNNFYTTIHFWNRTLLTFAAVIAGFYLGSLLGGTTQATYNAMLYTVIFITVLVIAILFVGNLIPRIIAKSAPESIAAALIPLYPAFSFPLKPFLHLAKKISERLRLVFPSKEEQRMTEDELRYALMEGEKSGIVESKERTMVEGVFYLGDRPLGTFMTHRSEIQWLDIHTPVQDIRSKVLEYKAQRCFPVADGTLDTIIGAAYLEDIILDQSCENPVGLRAIMKKALFAPETMPALKAFESFRRGKADYLFAIDEYGGFAGMVCVQDLMEEIVGELAAPVREEEQAVQQKDGSWLAGGSLNIDDAAKIFSLPDLATVDDYHTLAGFILSLAEELPRAGDSFTYQGYRFTVLEMDANRIDRISVRKENEKN